MKFIAFSDIHVSSHYKNFSVLERIANLGNDSKDIAFFVCAGDLGNLEVWEKFVQLIKKPLLYVQGNNDYDFNFRQEISKNAFSLHLNPVKINDFVFVGFSGAEISSPQIIKNLDENELKIFKNINLKTKDKDETHAKIRELAKILLLRSCKNIHAKNLIIVTHQQFHVLKSLSPVAHIFGHHHHPKYEKGKYTGTYKLNVSCGYSIIDMSKNNVNITQYKELEDKENEFHPSLPGV